MNVSLMVGYTETNATQTCSYHGCNNPSVNFGLCREHAKTEQLVDPWNLGSTSYGWKRIIIPISNHLINIGKLDTEAGSHWTLLTCDITRFKENVFHVQYRHFDSLKSSNNIESAKKVAEVIQQVS